MLQNLNQCGKAVDTHPSAIQFVPDWYSTQKISDKAVDNRPFVFDSIPV